VSFYKENTPIVLFGDAKKSLDELLPGKIDDLWCRMRLWVAGVLSRSPLFSFGVFFGTLQAGVGCVDSPCVPSQCRPC